MNTPNVERLKQLRRVVEAAPEDRLHMRAWCEEADCGTAYCAAGWAAIDPWFREHTEIGKAFRIAGKGVIKPNGDAGFIFKCLAKVFGIAVPDADELFGANPGYSMPAHAVTKAEVIANIDRLISGNHAEVYEAFRGYEQSIPV